MQEGNRINKPRVFLSHSRQDVSFIERLRDDLRRCQIDPWMDTDEIRHGKPWLKVIFEDGIRTCDVVIVYLTENSLPSKMVEKEIDAALIEQLTDSGISFLPYVNNRVLRDKLRGDVRSLQCLEWNIENYNEILPSVVAEIWRSYMERILKTAVLQERNRRLELELEVRALREKSEATIFIPSEEKDFQYIYSKLSKPIELEINIHKPKSDKTESTIVGQDRFKIPFLYVVTSWASEGGCELDWYSMINRLTKALEPVYLKSREVGLHYGNHKLDTSNASVDLGVYGLTKTVSYDDPHPRRLNIGPAVQYIEEFTDKMGRFRYWLEYHDTPLGEVEYIGFSELEPTNEES